MRPSHDPDPLSEVHCGVAMQKAVQSTRKACRAVVQKRSSPTESQGWEIASHPQVSVFCMEKKVGMHKCLPLFEKKLKIAA